MNSQPAFPGLCSIIVELFYAWQPFWVDRTESRLYNNITTVVITQFNNSKIGFDN